MPKKRVPRIMTVAELEEAGVDLEKKLSRQLVINKKNATCTINTWIKTHHLAYFIQAVAKYKDWNLHLDSVDRSRN